MPRRDEPDEEKSVRLDDDEHTWWSQRDVAQPWTPRAPAEPEPDPLDEHLGESWRVEFGFDPAPGGPAPVTVPTEPQDAYAVLAVDPEAPWEDIVAAHRREARRHHPDRFVEGDESARAAAEDRIRLINAAYRELKVRRSR